MANSSFSNILANKFDRNFGGTKTGTADPYISGYHFIKFQPLPAKLVEIVKNTYNQFTDINEIQNFLSATCLSVTPPGGTLNKTEFTGLGGTKWAVPTNIDYGNTLTMKFIEFSGTPILNIFHSWVRMIREYRTGTSALSDDSAEGQYTKGNYASTVFYWTTKPDGVTVEYYACYTGVFPTKDPQDLFSGDLTSIDKLEIDMEFSIDYVWREPWVKKYCEEQAVAFADKPFHGRITSSGSVLSEGEITADKN